ncbi:acyl carrier protein [Leeuwenhoekiella sp. A16]|uniref:acyl carrier protein n=1 Tax=unclassified Leeuwenhoekiella TaxID=2615029 RepID=UPI003A813CAC
MNKEVYNTLKSIIVKYLPEDVNVKQITPDSHLTQDLNINSTHLVDIVLDVEDEFDIMIEDDELNKMETVQKSIDLITLKLEAR